MTQQNGRDVDVLGEDGEDGESSLPDAMEAAVPQRAAATSEPVSSVSSTSSVDSVDSASATGSVPPVDPAVTTVFSVASIASAASAPATVPAMPEVPDIPAMPAVLTSASASVNGRDPDDSGNYGDSGDHNNSRDYSDSGNHSESHSRDESSDLSNPTDASDPSVPATSGDEPNPETLMIEQVEPHDIPVGAAASPNPPQISLAPIKKLRAQFNPLADGLVYLVVFIGGFVGTAARYSVSALFPQSATEFPLGTFIANAVACFLFSLLAETMAHASWIRRRARQLLSRGLGLGLCGGLSTMSTVAVESLTDILDHEPWMAVSYMVASVVVGTICCVAGVLLAHMLTSSRAAQSLRRVSTGSKTSHEARHADTMPVAGGSTPGGHTQATAGGNSSTADGSQAGGHHDGNNPDMPASFEPTPITAEIPLVPDPVTGEVH
ncbi:CrcB family protein [Bifidobacterium apri]|uniref:fluoride efflux transporter FluC n=1 Tax=Bifidobacterium apri TaxID=1769423 RepID=UPI0039944CB8